MALVDSGAQPVHENPSVGSHTITHGEGVSESDLDEINRDKSHGSADLACHKELTPIFGRQLRASVGINAVCLHTACSSQPYCFMAELKQVKKGYIGGNTDQFKKKAIDKAIKYVE